MTVQRKKLFRFIMPVTTLLLLAVMVIPVSAQETPTSCLDCGCNDNCTLTLGYWKTHSSYGPAPYDDVWGGREDLMFFSSGLTYIQVLNNAPKGNAYYILARQYIAGKFNEFVGVSITPEVTAALVWARDYFIAYNPTTGNEKPIRADAIYYADLIDQYNSGAIGPGHCSD